MAAFKKKKRENPKIVVNVMSDPVGLPPTVLFCRIRSLGRVEDWRGIS